MRKKGITSLFLLGLLALVIAFLSLCSAQKEPETWFKRVLITNDDGIGTAGIFELAQAFSKVAETYVVAPTQNCSGSGDYMSVLSKGKLTIEKRDMGEGIHAYAVDGFPADCVMVALRGIMKDNPPDVVISGINTGANLDWAWIGSGTIGAARVASFAGLPAIAVSGVDDDFPGALAAASRWVVRLAQSPSIQELGDYQYLTVDIPNIRPDEIQGVHVTQRAGLRPIFKFQKADTPEGAEGGEKEIWRITDIERGEGTLPDDSDLAFYRKGYIVIVPMKADEHDYDHLAKLKQDLSIFPPWEK
jgi:5'-nucleotidase